MTLLDKICPAVIEHRDKISTESVIVNCTNYGDKNHLNNL